MYKPAGHTSVSPYLIVDDTEVTLDFVKRVFGCQPLFEHRNAEGAIGHAEFRIDATVVMVGQASGGPDANVHVYVPDVDAVFRLAIEAGGTPFARCRREGRWRPTRRGPRSKRHDLVAIDHGHRCSRPLT